VIFGRAEYEQGPELLIGSKLHVGVHRQTKLIHSVARTPANVHDSQEGKVYRDRAYVGKEDVIQQKAGKAKSFIERRAVRNRPLTEGEKRQKVGLLSVCAGFPCAPRALVDDQPDKPTRIEKLIISWMIC